MNRTGGGVIGQRCLTALGLALSVALAAPALSPLERQWQAFPYAQLPTLPGDVGMRIFQSLLRRDGALKTARMSQNIFDPRNGYANLTLPDDSFLEFIVWTSADRGGYIVANRYRDAEQAFKVWRFAPGGKPQAVASPFSVSQAETSAAYRRITGQPLAGRAELQWDFPREGTTVTASFVPSGASLIRQCKAVSDVEYDCGAHLNIASFRWDGARFVKTVPAK